ncbi:hypothetical protein [Nostoc sp. ATCC 53789]|nr:hypothetical protein [Nostoc sp. ATCC 53789]
MPSDEPTPNQSTLTVPPLDTPSPGEQVNIDTELQIDKTKIYNG